MIVAAILATATVFSFAACVKDGDGSSTDGNETAALTGAATDEGEGPEILPEIGDPIKLPQGEKPLFSNVSVHDPSVTKVGDFYYIIGSHMQAAKSRDLMRWTQMSNGISYGSYYKVPMFEGPVNEELAAAVRYVENVAGKGNALFWAADWIQLRADGKCYMYYCVTTGNNPHSCIGMAVADDIAGPYTDLGIILSSPSADGVPNAIDPQAFYDKDGGMWLVYGSYSDGIYILELDPETGKPKSGQGYGTKLTGGYHTPIEGAYIIYSPETDYYYLFTSFGGLSSDAGYNMRVSRAKSPNGAYQDYEDQLMLRAAKGTLAAFDTSKIQNFGVKLFGNFLWDKTRNDTGDGKRGYISPGHNSVYYDAETGQYFLIFHTRFPGTGEAHEVRVHQMFLNEDGWFVVAPFRYGGETIGDYVGENIIGTYKYLNHGHEVTSNIVRSTEIKLNADYTVTNENGKQIGQWRLKDGHYATITIDGITYKGVYLFQYDEVAGAYVMTFSAASTGGVTIWGSHLYEP